MSSSDSVRIVSVDRTSSTYRVTMQYDTGVPSATRPTFAIEVPDSVLVSRFKVGDVIPVRDLPSLVESLTPAGGVPAIPFAAVVFQPGGVAGGNVYTTWANVMTALTALGTGVTRAVYFDNTNATCAIPAGGPYDMTNTRWLKQPGVVGVVPVQLDAGATVAVPPISIDPNLSLTA